MVAVPSTPCQTLSHLAAALLLLNSFIRLQPKCDLAITPQWEREAGTLDRESRVPCAMCFGGEVAPQDRRAALGARGWAGGGAMGGLAVAPLLDEQQQAVSRVLQPCMRVSTVFTATLSPSMPTPAVCGRPCRQGQPGIPCPCSDGRRLRRAACGPLRVYAQRNS